MNIIRISLFISLLLNLTLLFQTQLYRLFPKQSLSNDHQTQLFNLGMKALESNDVPVSAILFYNDSIIGTGYNTVNKDEDVTRHAEVNCINMAFKNFGEEFRHLDRNHLNLYTTYEPCAMCKGVMLNENIKYVYFEQNKGLIHMLKGTFKTLRYALFKRQLDCEGLQEKLFVLHPNYLKTRTEE